ncbi:MAG: hypothetical protein L0Z62_04165, partial [Gemmataceae bacterium]|nr:hypothetical protein [Gemmataceae bacterium]
EGQLRVPVTVKLADPLGRVRQVRLDCWAGKPGPTRAGSRKPPEPQAGDAAPQTVTLAIQQQAGRGELTLPPLAAGQVYWLQPSVVDGSGARAWLSAQVYRPSPPVERKPARLVLNPAGDLPLVLERWSTLRVADRQGRDHRVLVNQEIRLTDSPRGQQGPNRTLYRQFTGFKEGVSIDGETYMTSRLQHLAPNVQFVAQTLTVDAQGTTRRHVIDPKLRDSPPDAARRALIDFQEQMQKFLQGLEVPVPGEQVEVGQTWKAQRPMLADEAWKALRVLPDEIWGRVENDTLDMTYTYLGTRTVKGAEHAVIHLRGQSVSQPGGGPNSGARLSGTAVVDLATGQIVEQEVTTHTNIELFALNTVAVKAHGTVLARLRRE